MAGQIEKFKVTILEGNSGAQVLPSVAPGQRPVSLKTALGYAVQCTIFSPGDADGDVTVQYSADDDDLEWYDSDTVVTAASVKTFVPAAAEAMNLNMSTSAGADRDFWVEFQYDMAT